jgi:hypothetical protein
VVVHAAKFLKKEKRKGYGYEALSSVRAAVTITSSMLSLSVRRSCADAARVLCGSSYLSVREQIRMTLKTSVG